MSIEGLPRIPLAHLPTPLEEMPMLRRTLGPNCPRLLIKRDDATGLATGGNKTRKLEFSLGAALATAADHILTAGAMQSNHVRQTAAACNRLGLRCTIVLAGEPPPREQWNGNLLLDALLGAEIIWTSADRQQALEEQAELSRAAGNRPFIIPVGASDAIGAMGYVQAVEELITQLAAQDWAINRIVCTAGSGGTMAGILTGLVALGIQESIRVEGMVNGARAGQAEFIASLSNQLAEKLDIPQRTKLEAIFLHNAAGEHAYGVITDAEREAIQLLARSEGILADPIYTGRALAGLIERIRSGAYDPEETILFWHTGGSAGLFARARELLTDETS